MMKSRLNDRLTEADKLEVFWFSSTVRCMTVSIPFYFPYWLDTAIFCSISLSLMTMRLRSSFITPNSLRERRDSLIISGLVSSKNEIPVRVTGRVSLPFLLIDPDKKPATFPIVCGKGRQQVAEQLFSLSNVMFFFSP